MADIPAYISRGFRNLARNLGRVGPGSDSFASPRTIQPVLQADDYDPQASYAIWLQQVAVAGQFANGFLQFPAGVTVIPTLVYAGSSVAAIPVKFGRLPFGTPGAAVIVNLADGTPTVCSCSIGSNVALVLPATSPRIWPIFGGADFGGQVVELPPMMGPGRLVFECPVVNTPFQVTLMWREIRADRG